jgi:hypothetical protein
VDELAQPDYIRQDSDDGDVTTPRRGQQSHHHRDEPAAENALQDAAPGPAEAAPVPISAEAL